MNCGGIDMGFDSGKWFGRMGFGDKSAGAQLIQGKNLKDIVNSQTGGQATAFDKAVKGDVKGAYGEVFKRDGETDPFGMGTTYHLYNATAGTPNSGKSRDQEAGNALDPFYLFGNKQSSSYLGPNKLQLNQQNFQNTSGPAPTPYQFYQAPQNQLGYKSPQDQYPYQAPSAYANMAKG